MPNASQRFSFTEPAVKKLSPHESQYDAWDEGRHAVSGFGVRVAPSGRKTWQIVLRVFDPAKERWTPTRLALGHVGELSLADARDKATDLRRQAKDAKDIRKVAQRARDTALALDEHNEREAEKANSFGAVRADYLAYAVKRTRPATMRNYRNHLARFDAFADRPIGEVTREDLYTIIDRLIDAGRNVMGRRVHESLRRMYRWAIDEKRFTGEMPVKRERPGDAEQPNTRYLTDAEIGIVWRACEVLEPPQKTLFRLLMLLGQRSGETAGMRWSELSLDGPAPTWTIPPERAKTGKKVPLPHVLPLPAAAVTMLRALPRRPKNDLVFVRADGSQIPSDQGNVITRIQRQAAKIVAADHIDGVFAEDWSTHDLRRTLVTGLSRLGVKQEFADQIIHHKNSNLTTVARIYQQHTFEGEARGALELWAAHVLRLAPRPLAIAA